MGNEKKSLNEFQIALSNFKKNRWAVLSVYVLFVLYAAAVFADFLAPYSFKNENRSYSYCPPTKIHVMDNGKLSWPFVYGVTLTFDEFHKRVYKVNTREKFAVRFFVRGDEYRFLGLIPGRLHLFGVREPARLASGEETARQARFYLLGADSRGRDLFSRILYGARISLSIGLIGVLISFVIGLLVGGIAGYYGGVIDNALMRLCEMFMMIPGFYLLLALRSAVSDKFNSVQVYFAIIVILSFISWASLARIIRGMCLSLKEREYVLAAKAIGLSDLAIITRHILPHTMSYSIFAVMLSIPGYIIGESALSLIGLGIQDPYASWGNLLSDAMSIIRIQFAPWILWPAAFIFVTIVCFNVIGDCLRDCLDPLLSGSRIDTDPTDSKVSLSAKAGGTAA